MTRRRLPLEYVAANSARKAIFKKRENGLFKKLHELCTLCGINACIVIYSALDPQPDIWPPSATIVQGILTKFKEVPEVERAKRRISLEDYIMGRILKAEVKRMELINHTREKEITQVINRCLSMEILVSSLPMMELNDLRYVIDNTVTMLSKRIEMLKNNKEPRTVMASSLLSQPQVASLPMDQSQLGWPPMVDDDDRLDEGETSNPLRDDNVNISNIHDGVWPNTFRR